MRGALSALQAMRGRGGRVYDRSRAYWQADRMRHMAKRKASQHRSGHSVGKVSQHLWQIFAVFASRELSKSQSCQTTQDAGRTQLSQHPVHSMRCLVDVLNHENASVQFRPMCRPQQSRQQRQVRRNQWATRLARPQDERQRGRRQQPFITAQACCQRLHGCLGTGGFLWCQRLPAQIRAKHGAMHQALAALFPSRQQKTSKVAVANSR